MIDNNSETVALMKAVAELWGHRAKLASHKGMDNQKIDEKIFKSEIEIIRNQAQDLKKSHKKVLGLSEKLLNKKSKLSEHDFEILENASIALNPNADSDDSGPLPSLIPFKEKSKNMEFSVTVQKEGKNGKKGVKETVQVVVLNSIYLEAMKATSEGFAKNLSQARLNCPGSVESNKGVTTSNQRGCIMPKEAEINRIYLELEYDKSVVKCNYKNSKPEQFNRDIIELFQKSIAVVELLKEFTPSGSKEHRDLLEKWDSKLKKTTLTYSLDFNEVKVIQEQNLGADGYDVAGTHPVETVGDRVSRVKGCGSEDWAKKTKEPENLIKEIDFLNELSKGFEAKAKAKGSKRTGQINKIQSDLSAINRNNTLTLIEKKDLTRGCLLQNRADLGKLDRGNLAKTLDGLLKTPELRNTQYIKHTEIEMNKKFMSNYLEKFRKKEPKPKDGLGFMQKIKRMLGKQEPASSITPEPEPNITKKKI